MVMWKEWEMKIGKESSCPKSGGGKDVRKSDIAMEDCIKRHRKSERIMEKKGNRQGELETIGRECDIRKVRGRKWKRKS